MIDVTTLYVPGEASMLEVGDLFLIDKGLKLISLAEGYKFLEIEEGRMYDCSSTTPYLVLHTRTDNERGQISVTFFPCRRFAVKDSTLVPDSIRIDTPPIHVRLKLDDKVFIHYRM